MRMKVHSDAGKRIILLVRRERGIYKRGPGQKKGHSHAGAARKSWEETLNEELSRP